MNVLLNGRRAPDAIAGKGVDAELVAELRMLCRGLAHSSFWMLSTVRTVVRLPDDEASELALRYACAELAGDCGLESSVRWAGDAWDVCFTRQVADERAAQ